MTTLRLWWLLRRRESSRDRLPTLLAVLAFAVSSASLLVALGGRHAFAGRADAGLGGDYAQLYLGLAYVAVALLVVPILTLGAVAARLTVATRNARLASLRLTGATTAQVSGMTLLESAAQAGLGALVGALGYAAALVPLSALSFQGRRLAVAEMWVGVPLVAAVCLGVVVLAVASGLLGLTRVAVTPLGVANRATPPALSVLRLAALAVMVVVWFLAFQGAGQVGMGVLIALLAAVVATVNLVGPYVVMIIGRIGAHLARTPASLLAARRIVDDPAATWRSVSALALGITVAALSSIGSAFSVAGENVSAADRMLGVDVGTGALVALGIIAVVAATSTGVVQATRVLDQAPQYRALALAGAPTSLLHRARALEIGYPLLATIALGLAMPMLILLPMSGAIGVGFFLRTAAAIAVACLLTVLAAAASRPLVSRALQPT